MNRYENKLTAGYTEGKDAITSWTDTRGRTIKYEVAASSYYTEISDVSGGRHTSYGYEGTGPQLTSYRDANGNTTKYHYESENLDRITTPKGNVIKLVYDSKHRITEITRTTNTEHTTGPTTKFTYYEVGSAPSPCTAKQQGTVVKDADWTVAKAHETLYCSNVLDEVEKTVDASGNESTAVFNPFGDLTATTAAAPGGSESGGVTSLNYDKAGVNLECAIQGTSTPQSSCPTKPEKTALVTSFGYKDESNTFSATQVQNPQNNSTFKCYNKGKQEKSEAPACPASAESAPAGTLQNVNDQLSEQHELSFEYEGNGNIKSSTDADKHTTKYEYDEKGNLKKITPPGSAIHATTITVDGVSRPHVITDGAGHIETLTYDKLDRIVKIACTGTGTAKTVTYEYDADGNRTKREDSTGTTKYTVDALNRLTTEELPGSVTHSYEFDNASNMTGFTDGGGTRNYKYNGLNELESMTEPSATKSTSFEYNNDHKLTKITYPSGAKESYKLEAATGRPETITAEGITGTTVPKLTYTYKSGENNTSLIRSVTESTSNTTSYSYDALDRLTQAVSNGAGPNQSFYRYKLDGAGNCTEQAVNTSKPEETGGEKTYYASNEANELECRQTVAPPCSGSSSTELSHYGYDEAGEQTAITPKLDTSGATLAYNAASQMSTLTPSGESALSLTYGGTGQDDLVTRGSSTTIENSLLGLTREVTSAGADCFERTPNGLLIDIRTPTGNYNPLYDAQGDIIALVNTSGKVERTFHYGPYGENTKSEGTQTIPFPFGFKGGYRMPGGNTGKGNVASGLYHYGQRYYDPTAGRWTQQDPKEKITSATAAHRFLFAGADPINLSDPSGLSTGLTNEQACFYGALAGSWDAPGGPIIGCVSAVGANEVVNFAEEELGL